MTREQLLKVLFFTPGREGKWGLPALFWAAPGTGKSTILKNLGLAFGFSHVEILSPGERGEGAFGVIPVPDGQKITYPPPDWTSKFDNNVPGLVFVDEINRAAEALQPPLLGLVNDLRIGGHYLGNNTRVVAAANPAESAPGVYELDPAQANRMGHFDWEAPNVADWSAWAISGANDIPTKSETVETIEKMVMEKWPVEFAKAVGLVTAFLRSNPQLLHAQPKVGDPQIARAWPSPRSWELAMRAIAGAAIHMPGDESAMEKLMEGFVGTAACTAFATWRTLTDLPDPIAVLDGTEKFVHNAKKLDRTVAALASCAALVCPVNSEKRNERVKVLWKIINEVADKALDIVVPAAQSLAQAKLTTGKDAQTIMLRLFPLWQMAKK